MQRKWQIFFTLLLCVLAFATYAQTVIPDNRPHRGAQPFLNGPISGYYGKINAQTGTTYTLDASDAGKIVELNNAGAITLTLPATLAPGFICTITQTGAGQVTLSVASGATLHNRSSFTKTAGQWAILTLYVTTNAGGAAAVYIMGGDGA